MPPTLLHLAWTHELCGSDTYAGKLRAKELLNAPTYNVGSIVDRSGWRAARFSADAADMVRGTKHAISRQPHHASLPTSRHTALTLTLTPRKT